MYGGGALLLATSTMLAAPSVAFGGGRSFGLPHGGPYPAVSALSPPTATAKRVRASQHAAADDISDEDEGADADHHAKRRCPPRAGHDGPLLAGFPPLAPAGSPSPLHTWCLSVRPVPGVPAVVVSVVDVFSSYALHVGIAEVHAGVASLGLLRAGDSVDDRAACEAAALAAAGDLDVGASLCAVLRGALIAAHGATLALAAAHGPAATSSSSSSSSSYSSQTQGAGAAAASLGAAMGAIVLAGNGDGDDDAMGSRGCDDGVGAAPTPRRLPSSPSVVTSEQLCVAALLRSCYPQATQPQPTSSTTLLHSMAPGRMAPNESASVGENMAFYSASSATATAAMPVSSIYHPTRIGMSTSSAHYAAGVINAHGSNTTATVPSVAGGPPSVDFIFAAEPPAVPRLWADFWVRFGGALSLYSSPAGTAAEPFARHHSVAGSAAAALALYRPGQGSSTISRSASANLTGHSLSGGVAHQLHPQPLHPSHPMVTASADLSGGGRGWVGSRGGPALASNSTGPNTGSNGSTYLSSVPVSSFSLGCMFPVAGGSFVHTAGSGVLGSASAPPPPMAWDSQRGVVGRGLLQAGSGSNNGLLQAGSSGSSHVTATAGSSFVVTSATSQLQGSGNFGGIAGHAGGSFAAPTSLSFQNGASSAAAAYAAGAATTATAAAAVSSAITASAAAAYRSHASAPSLSTTYSAGALQFDALRLESPPASSIAVSSIATGRGGVGGGWGVGGGGGQVGFSVAAASRGVSENFLSADNTAKTMQLLASHVTAASPDVYAGDCSPCFSAPSPSITTSPAEGALQTNGGGQGGWGGQPQFPFPHQQQAQQLTQRPYEQPQQQPFQQSQSLLVPVEGGGGGGGEKAAPSPLPPPSPMRGGGGFGSFSAAPYPTRPSHPPPPSIADHPSTQRNNSDDAMGGGNSGSPFLRTSIDDAMGCVEGSGGTVAWAARNQLPSVGPVMSQARGESNDQSGGFPSASFSTSSSSSSSSSTTAIQQQQQHQQQETTASSSSSQLSWGHQALTLLPPPPQGVGLQQYMLGQQQGSAMLQSPPPAGPLHPSKPYHAHHHRHHHQPEHLHTTSPATITVATDSPLSSFHPPLLLALPPLTHPLLSVRALGAFESQWNVKGDVPAGVPSHQLSLGGREGALASGGCAPSSAAMLQSHAAAAGTAAEASRGGVGGGGGGVVQPWKRGSPHTRLLTWLQL